MSEIFRVTRRDFLRDLGVGAGALVLGCYIPTGNAEARGLAKVVLDILHNGIPLNNFVSMELDGTIIIMSHRSEMGQGIRSSLAAVLADELEADWGRVKVRQTDADAVLFGVPFPIALPGAPALVKAEDAQFVDSSRSMAAYYMPMRLFGAGIRLVMVRAAALKFGVDVSELEARQNKVYHDRSGRSVRYEHLLLEAAKVGEPKLPDVVAALKPKEKWTYIGKDNMPFIDAMDMVTGKAVYGADVDVKRGGMLTAMIERCPVANGRLKSFDATAALAVPGVKYVTPVLPQDFNKGEAGGVGAAFVPHAGVAVLAENTWAALQGRRALEIEWDLSGPAAAFNVDYDSDDFRDHLIKSTSQPGLIVRKKGNVDDALGPTPDVKANYYVPHLAQTPMEPPAAIAIYENEKWEIWSPTQGPELTQHYVGLYMLEPEPLNWLIWQTEEPEQMLKDCEKGNQETFNQVLARTLGVSKEELFKRREALKKKIREKVKVHVTLLGGGFGRKSNPDYAVEAAFLARQYPGVPIRVQWTREDDIQFSYYNAVSNQYYEATLGANGLPTAFLQRSAFTSFFATLFPPTSPHYTADQNNFLDIARSGFHNGGKYPYGSAIEKSQGLEDMPYEIDNVRIENCPAESHIRCGWMRSVANIYHAFGTCSFADELAHKAGRDSKDYLLELIGKGHRFTQADLVKEDVLCLDNNQFPVDPLIVTVDKQPLAPILEGYGPDTRRLRAVVERAARESGWDEKVKRYKGTRRGLGIAAHRSFLSYVAIVVDVSLSDANDLTINEMYGVIDCGIAVNLDRVRAQMEGGMLYGLSLALLGEITVRKGAVVQHNFHDYPVLRIHHAPRILKTFVEDPSAEVAKEYYGGQVPPSGAGEPPTPAVAPALANAIVAAGGPRIRAIPFCKEIGVH